jgi:hypothetical protein
MDKKIPGLRTVLRFSNTNKAYSAVIPETWNIAQLIQFINYAFKEETNGRDINLLFGAKRITNYDQLVKSFYNNKEILHFIITIKRNKNQENDKSQFFKSQNKQELVKSLVNLVA